MNEIGYTKSWRKKYSGKTAKRGLLYLGAMDWIVGNAAWRDDADSNEARGDIATSLSELAKQWKISVKAVRIILQNLVEDEFIQLCGCFKNGGGTLIKIINYNTYQANSEKPKSPHRASQGASQGAS